MSLLNIPNRKVRPSLDDFDIICRICLVKNDDKNKMQPIQAYIDKWNPEKVVNLYDKIRVCSDINIEDNIDILPNNICDKCVNLLLIAHYFKTLSANSDKVLRKIIEHSERPVVIKIEVDTPDKSSDYSLFDGKDASSEISNSCDISKIVTGEIKIEVIEFKDGNQDIINVTPKQDGQKKNSKNMNHDLVGVFMVNEETNELELESNVELNENEENNEIEIENDEEFNETEETNEVEAENDVELNEHEVERIVDLEEIGNKRAGYYECLLCNLPFNHIGDLTSHMYSEHPTESYKCYGCDKFFEKYSKRTEHEKYSCPNMPPGSKYECSQCKEKCDNRFRFDSHTKFGCKFRRENKTLELEPLYKCPHCKLTTMRKSTLRNHILICHTEEKPYVCEVCGKGYPILSCLNNHRKQAHTDEKNFKCPYCTYAARQKSSLNIHMRRHTLEYNYACEFCGAVFKQNTAYHVHMRRHHREKEFQCEICKKMFSVSHALKQHVSSVHLGLKPHECETCGAAYSKRRSLRAHMLRVHDIIMKSNKVFVKDVVVVRPEARIPRNGDGTKIV